MIRATFDTNVLVSALNFGGVPGELLDLHTGEAFTLCLSHTIIDELRRILVERLDWTDEDLESALRMRRSVQAGQSSHRASFSTIFEADPLAE